MSYLFYQYIYTDFSAYLVQAYARRPFVPSCRSPTNRKISHAVIKSANTPNCLTKFSWRYICGLDIIYCTLVYC